VEFPLFQKIFKLANVKNIELSQTPLYCMMCDFVLLVSYSFLPRDATQSAGIAIPYGKSSVVR